MNILMISSTFPYPPSKGGTQGRTFNLLKHLSKNHDITLIVQRTSDVRDEEVEKVGALLNQDMNTNCASYPQVSLVLGFKNCREENSYLKSATPIYPLAEIILIKPRKNLVASTIQNA